MSKHPDVMRGRRIATSLLMCSLSAAAVQAQQYEVYEIVSQNPSIDSRYLDPRAIFDDGTVVGVANNGTNDYIWSWNVYTNVFTTRQSVPVAYDLEARGYVPSQDRMYGYQNFGGTYGYSYDALGNKTFIGDSRIETIKYAWNNGFGTTYVYGRCDYLGADRGYYYNVESNRLTIVGTSFGDACWINSGNNDLDMCGGFRTGSVTQGFVYIRSLPSQMTGFLPGDERSEAFAMNESLHVVGSSWDADSPFAYRAFLWKYNNGSPTIQDLGNLSYTSQTYARDISNSGMVVGTDFAAARAFFWKDGAIGDLNTLADRSAGWLLEEAEGISDNEELIAGVGRLNGTTRAYVLVPKTFEIELDGACPGPATIIATGATPNAIVAIEYSHNGGSFIIPPSYACAGLRIDMGLPLLPGSPVTKRADANGRAEFPATIRSISCGKLRLQGIDVATCTTSNLILVN